MKNVKFADCKNETMRKTILTFTLVLASAFAVLAQTPRNIAKESIPVSMVQVTYAAQFPGFDTRTDYGFTNTIGGSIIHKTQDNWIFTFNGNFIFGDQIKGSRIDLLGESITTVYGEVIGGGGLPTSLAFFQRGMHFQGEIGKLFPIAPNPNSGIFVQVGAGYLRNRLRIEYQIEAQNPPYPLTGDYQYGYDRMRGGAAFHIEAGYMVLSNARVYNFSISLEATYARTKDLRDYDFRVFYDENGEPHIMGYTNNNPWYNDFYYGIRVGWMIPFYQRQPDAYYYN